MFFTAVDERQVDRGIAHIEYPIHFLGLFSVVFVAVVTVESVGETEVMGRTGFQCPGKRCFVHGLGYIGEGKLPDHEVLIAIVADIKVDDGHGVFATALARPQAVGNAIDVGGIFNIDVYLSLVELAETVAQSPDVLLAVEVGVSVLGVVAACGKYGGQSRDN